MTSRPKQAEYVHLRDAGAAECEVHEWPSDGLGRRLIDAMRERHGKGGINVCRACIDRAYADTVRALG